jgi:hypothetical protein
VKKLPRIVTAEPVIHGVLKIVWNDGYEVVEKIEMDIDALWQAAGDGG